VSRPEYIIRLLIFWEFEVVLIMKKKVLFILHIPPPVHGAAMVGSFIKESKRVNETFDADYINLTTSFELDKIGKGGFDKFIAVLKIQARISKALIATDYDLCYMTLTAKGPGFFKDLFMVGILKVFRKKILYHFHNKGVKENDKGSLRRLLYRFAFKNTQSILLSPELYDDISDYVSRDDIYFCPNGIPDVAGKISKNTVLENPKPVCRFLFLSNMMLQKGVLMLLKACFHLKNRNLSFECHFVGAWSDVSETDFRKRVDEYDISEHILTHGKKYGNDKVAYLKNADVFVFPTHYDCFPLVLLEAMQYSLPIISTVEGGIPSIVVDGETGVLIPRKNDLKLADTMEKFILKPDDGIHMGQAGRKRYEEMFTLPVFESNFIDIMQKASSS